ncbi:MAG TPA: aldehyde dehydrogenase family protein, partial [Pseudonocardia sp.]|nr:aldehyde dehydrogenase family protein [Pseudonocardia sp.]
MTTTATTPNSATGPDTGLVSVNPARTDEVVGTAVPSDLAGFVDACRGARAAQRGWAAVPAPVRGRVVEQIGRLVEANKESLSRLVTREIGKPLAESRGEVQEVIDT